MRRAGSGNLLTARENLALALIPPRTARRLNQPIEIERHDYPGTTISFRHPLMFFTPRMGHSSAGNTVQPERPAVAA
jgi:hypothetical protein